MTPIELQIIAIITMFLVAILTIKDTRVRDILTIVPIGVIMILLLKDQSYSSASSSNELTRVMTEFFQTHPPPQPQSQSQPRETTTEQFMQLQPNTAVGHSILGPIQDLQNDPLYPRIASHVNTRVFLIKSPGTSQRNDSFMESFESPFSSSSYSQYTGTGSGMGLSTFFQNQYSSTPGDIWGAVADDQNTGRIVLHEPSRQMVHDPKLTSLISTMILRYPNRKNDLLEVSRRYHHEVLGGF